VFNGFEGLVKSLYSSFYTDLKILPAEGKMITLTQAQLDQLRSVKGVKNFSLVVEEKALLQNDEYQSVVYLKGVDENYRYVTGVADHVVTGKFNLGTKDAPSLVMGAGIENAVGIQADRNIFPLVVYLPRKGVKDLNDPLNAISADTVTSSGSFMIQQDFDNKYAITNLDFMKEMLGMGKDEYGGAEITVTDPSKTEEVQAELKKIFTTGYKVETRYEQNQGLYAVMSAERWVIYAVLSLILVVAAFTMIGSLTMLVLEKEKDINVLHALGADTSFIQKIFLSEGLLLASAGGIIGMLLALIILLLQMQFKLIPLQGGSFLIDYFPVKLKLFDFLLVGGTVFVIALIASWLPSRKAAAQELSLRSE
jgi:lipoprotein-releasing system permease protein